MNEFAETGKISDDVFGSAIYPFCGSIREEVVVPARYGVDVSIVNLPGGYEMALTSDPLSLVPSLGLRESAWLSVQLAANDMATTGIAPMYAQFVLNLPPAFTDAEFETYWRYIHEYCAAIGTTITGGHTGRFEGQNSTVAGGVTMVAIARQGTMLASNKANNGDLLVIAGGPAITASSILALSFPETVRGKCGVEVQQKASALFYETSVLRTGIIAAGLNKDLDKKVTAMHDVTEGGIMGSIYEMATASGLGVTIEKHNLPVGEVQERVCDVFGINPYCCVGAGTMIIAVKEESAEQLIDALASNNIKAMVAGKLVEKEQGIHMINNGEKETLVRSGKDPYWNAFYEAIKKGWK